MKSKSVAILLVAMILMAAVVSFASPSAVFAQNINLIWTRWDAQITAQENNQLQVVETQEIAVSDGSVSKGTRYWTAPVNIQQVYVVTSDDQNPRALTQSSSGQPGTYTVTTSNGNPMLQYVLPSPQGQGRSFLVQIGYTATSPTTGMVDWKVIPADHAFPVRSSTVTLHFPNGQAPDPSLVRTSDNASVKANGNDIIIQSTRQIPAQQAFTLQVPFGAGVGAAGGTGGSSGGSNNAPAPIGPDSGDGTTVSLPSGGILLLILCGVGVLLLFGGGNLLRSLLGSFLGGGFLSNLLGGINRGGSSAGDSQNQNPLQSDGGLNRGFRQSANQDRQIGSVGNDKDSGGGASFS